MIDFKPIKIESGLAPLSLVLNPEEYETRYSSFRCVVVCSIKHATGRFSFSAADVCFGTEQFDRFMSELAGMVNGTHPQARLADLSDHVVLTIAQQGTKTATSLRVFVPGPDGEETRLGFSVEGEGAVPSTILSQLAGYERWW